MIDLRFVVDDSTFALPGQVDARELEDACDRLSDELQICRQGREKVGIITDYDIVECLPGIQLHELLSSDVLPRDCRLRVYGLLDKCSRFDKDPAFVIDPAVEVDGVATESYALALVCEHRRARSSVGALAFFPRYGPSPITVRDGIDAGPVFLVADEPSRVLFYRSIFEGEDIAEERFFPLAAMAFPRLRFAPSLSFRRFEGTYAQLRDVVVVHLSRLNDAFREVLQTAKGMSDQVSAAMGIDMSIEGSTRDSEALMRYRDVEYGARVYRCEWHSKIEPHRNRIHVHPGDEETDDCVLIGIFVDHLPT
jgi:hypothetical protein